MGRHDPPVGKLAGLMLLAQAVREARFNRMFEKVSQGRAKKCLLDHGCAPW